MGVSHQIMWRCVASQFDEFAAIFWIIQDQIKYINNNMEKMIITIKETFTHFFKTKASSFHSSTICFLHHFNIFFIRKKHQNI